VEKPFKDLTTQNNIRILRLRANAVLLTIGRVAC